MKNLNDLKNLLTLKQTDRTTFEGQNFQAPWGRVFGGQVLAQSLSAAYQTVPEDRLAHSMHGYFILGGQLDIPVTYEVDTIRDGKSFTTRRIVARQNGKAIFNSAVSFHIEEKGVEHQSPMPNILPPEKLNTSLEQIEEIKSYKPEVYRRLKMLVPEVFNFRSVERVTSLLTTNGPAQCNLWLKISEKEELSKPLQQQLLAYVSDYNILNTATLPHRTILNSKPTFYASLDHALWFHRDFDIRNWLLYTMDSPSAGNSRGFARGTIFDRQGSLIASVAQEGLIRQG